MLAGALLLILLTIATITDWRQRKIPNRLTYTGMFLALALNAAATWASLDAQQASAERFAQLGFIGFGESAAGWAVCGALMLVCYVFFPGGVGGGDVKLLATVGAFIGVYPGLEVLLWTFVVGGCFGLLRLIWHFGAARLIARSASAAYHTLRFGSPSLTSADRAPLQAPLLLAPCAAVAVAVVQLAS